MRFLLDIILPLLIAGISIGIISYLINIILRLIKLDIAVIKLVLFLGAWYFVGPIIYDFILGTIIKYENEIIVFIYKPVQIIMTMLKI
jgi:hypothetical protein